VAHGFTCLHREHLETGGSGLASSPLPFLAGGEKQHHLQSQTNNTNNQFFFLSSLFRSVFCCLPPSLFYSLPKSDRAFGVAMGLALLLCTWPLKLLLRWEWLFGQRVLYGLPCLGRCGRRRAGFAGDGKVADCVEA